eukprot:COSAG01_NODE_54309_length_333_cov_0.512821_2_plen_58_part_01
MAHIKAGGTEDSYFALDHTAGRKPTLDAATEAMAAATMDLAACTGIGKDYKRTKKYLG